MSLAPVAEPARPFLAALLARKLFRPLLIVTDSLKAQEAYELSLIAFGAQPQFYPAWESPPHTGQLPSADVIADRLKVLKSLCRPERGRGLHPESFRGRPPPTHRTAQQAPDGGGAEAPPTFSEPQAAQSPSLHYSTTPSLHPPIIVASVQSLLQRTFSPEAFRSLLLELGAGQELEMAGLIERLAALGYAREAQVQERGRFAVRGGILDLFPLDEPTPLRVEFFGDSIDSLRRF
ncbi:MAG: hypothetical protein FJ388_18595, partial [Verrucomicrobia bacterium]|nr:hypothetical protein [Verrucomicrobiota bacterium]